MAIEVHKHYGLTKEQAILEAVSKGLLVTTQEANTDDPVGSIHWHTWDTHLYLIEGEFADMDPSDPSIIMEAGDYFVVPARTLHLGRALKRCELVVGLSQSVFADLTIQREPEEL